MFLRFGVRLAPSLFLLLAPLAPACGSSFSAAADGGSSRDTGSGSDGITPSEGSSDTGLVDIVQPDVAPSDGRPPADGPVAPFACGGLDCKVGADFCEEDMTPDLDIEYHCRPETCTPDPGCDCALQAAKMDNPVGTSCHVKVSSKVGECRIECSLGVTTDDGGGGFADAPIVMGIDAK